MPSAYPSSVVRRDLDGEGSAGAWPDARCSMASHSTFWGTASALSTRELLSFTAALLGSCSQQQQPPDQPTHKLCSAPRVPWSTTALASAAPVAAQQARKTVVCVKYRIARGWR
jgi:hypothetical protein